MNHSNLILDGVQLMFTGMGMVFVFLSILVFLTGFMQKLFGESLIEKKLVENNLNEKTSLVSDDEVAAISAAIHQFRNKQ